MAQAEALDPAVQVQTAAGVLTTADGTPLKVSLRRANRLNQWRAFVLVAPLLLFILVTFLVPIFEMTFRSVENSLVSRVLHRTVPLLREWDERSGELPDEAVYAALLADVEEGFANRTIGKVGTRLNYEEPGMSSIFRSSPRKFKKITEGPYKEQIIKANKGWGKIRHLAHDQARERRFYAVLLPGRGRPQAPPRRRRGRSAGRADRSTSSCSGAPCG